jgi:regulator of protease activity HflC (stomatin/prohibitin superfamily)
MTMVTVQAWERAVVYRDGKLTGVLEPGRHRVRSRTKVLPVDTRPQEWPVSGQEVITADRMSVRVSVHVQVRVTDPERYVSAWHYPQLALHAPVQLALREAAITRTMDELLEQREAVNAELLAAATPAAERTGVEVLALAVRDIMLPGEVRRAAADVVLARQRGLAELERARSEAAALRTLANSARLLADHPELIRLRTIQAAQAVGATLVITDK